jgi:hypothetical protein
VDRTLFPNKRAGEPIRSEILAINDNALNPRVGYETDSEFLNSLLQPQIRIIIDVKLIIGTGPRIRSS